MVVSAEGRVMVMAHSCERSSPGISSMIKESKGKNIRLAMVLFDVGIVPKPDHLPPVDCCQLSGIKL
jgi:hypothetical protein